jgi:hypothetical protein
MGTVIPGGLGCEEREAHGIFLFEVGLEGGQGPSGFRGATPDANGFSEDTSLCKHWKYGGHDEFFGERLTTADGELLRNADASPQCFDRLIWVPVGFQRVAIRKQIVNVDRAISSGKVLEHVAAGDGRESQGVGFQGVQIEFGDGLKDLGTKLILDVVEIFKFRSIGAEAVRKYTRTRYVSCSHLVPVSH